MSDAHLAGIDLVFFGILTLDRAKANIRPHVVAGRRPQKSATGPHLYSRAREGQNSENLRNRPQWVCPVEINGPLPRAKTRVPEHGARRIVTWLCVNRAGMPAGARCLALGARFTGSHPEGHAARRIWPMASVSLGHEC